MIEKFDSSHAQSVARHAAALFAIVAAVTAVMSAAVWYINSPFSDTARYIALTHGIYWVIILYMIWLILIKKQPEYLGIPRIRATTDDNILIVENSPWLGVGIAVAIYEVVEEVERLISYGEVVNVQTNGLVQISLRTEDALTANILGVMEKIKSNKRGILIRPGLYRGAAR